MIEFLGKKEVGRKEGVRQQIQCDSGVEFPDLELEENLPSIVFAK